MSIRRVAAVGVTLLVVAGCASAGGVSTQQEVQLGAQEAQQVNAQLPMLNDAEIDQYVNALGTDIASRTARSDLSWHFAVVNTSDVNAFALPGGYVYVNRGVIERAATQWQRRKYLCAFSEKPARVNASRSMISSGCFARQRVERRRDAGGRPRCRTASPTIAPPDLT